MLGPGATVLTRTPRGPYSSAHDLVSEWIAALVALYRAEPPMPMSQLMDPMLMIDPAPWSAIAGAITPVSRNGAVTLTANASRTSCSGTSAVGVGVISIAALLTRMSMRPPAQAIASSASRRTCAAPAPRSAATNAAEPPLDSTRSTMPRPRAVSRPVTMTNAPCCARAVAKAAPRPPVEPVTSAVRPASRVVFGLMSPHAPLSKMDLQVQNLTAKGRATRARIVEGAAAEVRARGVAVTTLDDVRARTQTSKSQLFHYFPGGKEQLLLAVAEHEAQRVLSDQQPHLSALTSWAAWQRWRDVVVQRYRRQGQHCPLSMLMSEIGRTTPGARAVTATLLRQWHDEIAIGVRHMQGRGQIAPSVDAGRVAASLLAGIQGGVGIMLSTGDLSYLEAALGVGIESFRRR